MSLRRSVGLWIVPVLILLSSVSLWAVKEFVKPVAQPANSYPSRDAHPEEKVTAAVDVYNSSPKSDIFITHYVEDGILPVFLVITNDGNQPISVNNMRAQLVTSGRSKLEDLDADDVFRRVAHIKTNTTNPGHVGPIPLPGGMKNKKAQQQYEEIRNALFTAAAVEPHSTQSGFLFFDIQDVKNPVAGSHVYLTGVRDAGGNELMYFDITVIPSNSAAP